MLASITPFGERGRHNRWSVTVGAYLLGSLLGGALLGTALGGLGQLAYALLGDGTSHAALALTALALLAATGLALDLHLFGTTLQTNHRQVNERWIDTYRGWVYGFGFGLQLGLAFVTIVTTSATYLAFAAALLSGSWLGGLVIGATFGLARGLPILLTHRAVDPARLRALISRSQGWLRPVARVALGVQGLAVVTALALVPGRI